MNGDVWVHGDFAYVGTWVIPCNGRGVKIVDVSKLRHPQLIGTAAARRGTSAEDLVVRRVSTPSFSGDLLAVGIQRCGGGRALDRQEFGLELWNVTDPYHPEKLGEFPVGTAAEACTSSISSSAATGSTRSWPIRGASGSWTPATSSSSTSRIPRFPVQVAEWGAGEAGSRAARPGAWGPLPRCSATARGRARRDEGVRVLLGPRRPHLRHQRPGEPRAPDADEIRAGRGGQRPLADAVHGRERRVHPPERRGLRPEHAGGHPLRSGPGTGVGIESHGSTAALA